MRFESFNQFLLNGKTRLLDSGPGTSVSTSTPACFLAGAVISQLVGQILLKRRPFKQGLAKDMQEAWTGPLDTSALEDEVDFLLQVREVIK